MKKQITLGLCLLSLSLVKAQNVSETTFTENNKTMEGFGFNISLCNKDVLLNSWKSFIKKYNGKVKGGLINKAVGVNIKFKDKVWNGSFAYNTNDNNTINILTSFYDTDGQFLTSSNTPEEYALANTALELFRQDIRKACYADDVTHALNYKNSLTKEKAQNISRISTLETNIKKDSISLSNENTENISQKQVNKVIKLRQNIASGKVEKETLEKRNEVIDNEINGQELVIKGFEQNLENPESLLDESISETKSSNKVILDENIQKIEGESIKDAEEENKNKKEENIVPENNYFDK